MKVFERAVRRASEGKGEQRHGNGKPFMEQPVMLIREMVGSGFTLGQAMKKIHESKNLVWKEKIPELLDVLVYMAAEILFVEKSVTEVEPTPIQPVE